MTEALNLLIDKKGLKVNESALESAVRVGTPDLLRFLIQKGTFFNEID